MSGCALYTTSMNILIGIIGCVVGVVYLKYSFQIKEFIGPIGFAERYLGSGGTHTFHKLIGILIIVGSIMYAFGGLQELIARTLGRFV